MPPSDTSPSPDDFSFGTSRPPLKAGTLLFERYCLVRLVAREDFGVLWQAQDIRLDLPVALRLLTEWIAHDETSYADIGAAVRKSMDLRHHRIVGCYGCERDGNHMAIVGEFVDGKNLADLRNSQPNRVFTSHEIAGWVGQLISGLIYGHHEGYLIHGAIRPDHLFIHTATSQLKLATFGIDNALWSSFSRVMQRPQQVAPLHYVPPDQMVGREPHPADDIYSLGITLYELLTGFPPFFRGDVGTQIMEAPPQPLSQRLLEMDIPTPVPSAWESIIMRCLAKQRDHRPTLREIAKQLGLSLDGLFPTDSVAEVPSQPKKDHRESSDRFIERNRAPRCHIEYELNASPPAQPPPADPPPDGPNGPDDSSSPHYPPENVQFTVFRPRSITKQTWRKMLVYTHLDDGPADQPTPLEKVREEVSHLLRHESKDYADVTKDSRALIPREAEIQFVPRAAGVRFNPPSRSFFWTEGIDMHREEFEVRAAPDATTETLTGSLTVYLGVLIVGEIPLRFQLVAQVTREAPAKRDVTITAKPYRNIFPSYSRRDDSIVQQLEAYAATLGDSYLKDITSLRAGERWSPRLLEFIQQADVFQLFWSPRSAQSDEVAKEWRHALLQSTRQQKPNFIRPTYWDEPMPPAPAELSHLHFHRLEIRGSVRPSSTATITGTARVVGPYGLHEIASNQDTLPFPPVDQDSSRPPEHSPITRLRKLSPESDPEFESRAQHNIQLLERQSGEDILDKPHPRNTSGVDSSPFEESAPASPSGRIGLQGIAVIAFLLVGFGTYSMLELRDAVPASQKTVGFDGPTMPGPTMPGPTMPGPTMPGPTMPGPTEPNVVFQEELESLRRRVLMSESILMSEAGANKIGEREASRNVVLDRISLGRLLIEMSDPALLSEAKTHFGRALYLTLRTSPSVVDPVRVNDFAWECYWGLAQIAFRTGDLSEAQRLLVEADEKEKLAIQAGSPLNEKNKKMKDTLRGQIERASSPATRPPSSLR